MTLFPDGGPSRLECFPIRSAPPELVPGRPDRDWMDEFTARHSHRCLPLSMADTTGWDLLCPFGFEAEWNGGLGVEAFAPERASLDGDADQADKPSGHVNKRRPAALPEAPEPEARPDAPRIDCRGWSAAAAAGPVKDET